MATFVKSLVILNGLVQSGTAAQVDSGSMVPSGVSAGSYGDGSHTLTLTVDAAGRITGITTNPVVSSGVSSLNSLTGALTLAAGSNVTITPSGNTLTIAASAPASGVSSLNSLTGALSLVAGANITITPSGSNITIAASGGSGGGGVHTPTGNYTAQASDAGKLLLFECGSAGIIDLSLPTPSGLGSSWYVDVRCYGGASAYVNISGAAQLDGIASYSVNLFGGQATRIYCDGSNYWTSPGKTPYLDNYLYVPSGSGAPGGTPLTALNLSPIYVDTTGKIWAYMGTAWKSATLS